MSQPVSKQIANQYLLYDAAFAGSFTADWLSIDYWHDHAKTKPVGPGRGSAWFIATDERDYVLRHYRRGGLVARISRDRYLWTGLKNTRAWREWHLLALLTGYQLPVPVPVAARVIRAGLFYSADLLTIKLQDTVSLSDYLKEQTLTDSVWQEIGQTLRRFHQHQVYHADLNAHNVLLDGNGKISLIDFDRGCIRSGSNWRMKNLKRLYQSLTKLATQSSNFHFNEDNWQQLLAAYQTG